MKRLCLSLVFISVITCLSSFNTDWKRVRIERFSAEFPVQPEIQEQKIPSAVGELTLKIAMAQLEDEHVFAYGMVASSYPPNTLDTSKAMSEKFFRGAVDGAVKNVNGKLLSETIISHDKYPGRDFRVDYQGIAVIRMKMYLVGHETVVQQVIYSKEIKDSSNIARFFNSLKID